MLLLLAPELIREISDQLAIDDIQQLRLTCKDLGNILAFQVFRSLTIDITCGTLLKSIPKLQMMARKESASSRGTRKLTIRALAPKFDPKYRVPVWNPTNRSRVSVWVQKSNPENPPEIRLAEDEMKKCLYGAVVFLQCLRTVSWIPSAMDDTWTHIRVMDALINISSLESLHIDISFCQAEVPFHLFKNLGSISISGIKKPDHSEKTLDNLAKMIAQSQQLESISIDYGAPRKGNKLPSLPQFFKYYPKGLPPLRLRFLSMIGCLAHFDETTMPHLQHLRCLNWIGIVDAQPSYRSHSDCLYPALETKQRQGTGVSFILETSAAVLWTTLCHSKIHLEETTVDTIVPEFINYIGSFSGMRKLSIKACGFFLVPLPFDTMESSFHMALQRHIQSLEELHVTYLRELWCFGAHNSMLISQYLKLEELHMWIEPRDMLSLNVIKLLLDTVTTNNPKLNSLRITLAPGASDHVHRNLLLCIENYTAPISCTRLPSLRIGFKVVFVGYYYYYYYYPAEDGRLRYRNCSRIPLPDTIPRRMRI